MSTEMESINTCPPNLHAYQGMQQPPLLRLYCRGVQLNALPCFKEGYDPTCCHRREATTPARMRLLPTEGLEPIRRIQYRGEHVEPLIPHEVPTQCPHRLVESIPYKLLKLHHKINVRHPREEWLFQRINKSKINRKLFAKETNPTRNKGHIHSRDPPILSHKSDPS